MHGAEKYKYSVSFSSPMADDVKNLTRQRFVYHRRGLDRVYRIMPSVALTALDGLTPIVTWLCFLLSRSLTWKICSWALSK